MLLAAPWVRLPLRTRASGRHRGRPAPAAVVARRLQAATTKVDSDASDGGGGGGSKLSYSSAVVLVPPRDLWGPLQDIRRVNDKGFLRWPPHVTLLYPFAEDADGAFEGAGEAAAAALAGMPAFEVTLDQIEFFRNGPYCTVWAGPSDPGQLEGLQAALRAALADPPDGRKERPFVPHLSLGQFWPHQVEETVASLREAWEPITFTAGEVDLLSRRSFYDPFDFRIAAPLGGGAVRARDEPYVAAGDGDRRVNRPGVAAPEGTVWNFAYGANIKLAKMTEARGLTPLASAPGVLRGWSLAFNHAGAMGNVVRDAGGECHGVLHLLTCSQFARLQEMEHQYSPTEVEVDVTPYGGEGTVRAAVFESLPGKTIERGLPVSRRYMRLLVEGAREWPLDAAYCAMLEGVPTVDGAGRGPEYWRQEGGTGRIDPGGKVGVKRKRRREGSKGRRSGGAR